MATRTIRVSTTTIRRITLSINGMALYCPLCGRLVPERDELAQLEGGQLQLTGPDERAASCHSECGEES